MGKRIRGGCGLGWGLGLWTPRSLEHDGSVRGGGQKSRGSGDFSVGHVGISDAWCQCLDLSNEEMTWLEPTERARPGGEPALFPGPGAHS